MSVLSRSALEESPLADLHVIASEMGIDGFRRLRKADLIDAIVAAQGGGSQDAAADEGAGDEPDDVAPLDADEQQEEDERPSRPRRGRRGGRGRRGHAAEGGGSVRDEDPGDDRESEDSRGEPHGGGDREPRGGGDRGRAPDRVAEGTVELLGNGSGFLRVSPPEPSDEDVYISAAQVRRCELVSGDTISGPVRAPRRSERYPSLIRIDTINGRPADEVAEGTHFDDLPCAWPSERFALASDDPTLRAIEWLTPLGRGSRVAVVGPGRAGKSEALRRLVAALAALDGVEVSLVLAGVRPEEVPDWSATGVQPAATVTLGASADAQAQAVERAVDTARRIAARGGHAVLAIDTLDGLPPHAARRALSAARAIVDGGSLTIVATAAETVGGETTVIALDRALTSTGRFPALALADSGTLRAELLVGQAGADAIAQARAAALGQE